MPNKNIDIPITDTDELVLQYSSESFQEQRKDTKAQLELFCKASEIQNQLSSQDKIDRTTACEVFTMIDKDLPSFRAKLTSTASIVNKEITMALLNSAVNKPLSDSINDEVHLVVHQLGHYVDVYNEIGNYLNAFLEIIRGIHPTTGDNDFDIWIFGKDQKSVNLYRENSIHEVCSAFDHLHERDLLTGEMTQARKVLDEIKWIEAERNILCRCIALPSKDDILTLSIYEILTEIRIFHGRCLSNAAKLNNLRNELSERNDSLYAVSKTLLDTYDEISPERMEDMINIHRELHKQHNVYDLLVDYIKAVAILSKDNVSPLRFSKRVTGTDSCYPITDLGNNSPLWSTDSLFGRILDEENQK